VDDEEDDDIDMMAVQKLKHEDAFNQLLGSCSTFSERLTQQ
jgi:hypothetical protein